MSDLSNSPTGRKAVLVIGGGLSGMTTAIETAEVGYEAYIVEKSPYLGGRVAQLNQYFPKLCPPYCGLEINFKRIRTNPRIQYFTTSEVVDISGQEGNFNVKVRQNPRYVNNNCTACNDCVAVCPVERSNDFNLGMSKTKAIYLPHEMAYPTKYVIDGSVCKGSECNKCVDVCKYKAIELDMKPKETTLNVASVVYATGWKPYDANKMDNLGMQKYDNVISNIMMERLAASNGPTRGKLVRPSDGKEAKTVVFVQCAGSRDENHLNYCSSICCMASLKQTTYVRTKYPEDSKVYFFYIDSRTPGKYEKFLSDVRKDQNVHFIKGKVAKVTEDPGTKNLIVEAENAVTFEKLKIEADLVVLASGMEPNLLTDQAKGVSVNPEGFITPELQKPGIFSTGVAKAPVDVVTSIQDATGVALKAIQSMRRA